MGLLLLCAIGLFFTACTTPEHTTTPIMKPVTTSAPLPTATFTPTPLPATPTPVPEVSEAELLKHLEREAGTVPETYLYADFDHNGGEELFAVLMVENLYQIWFCNSDGTCCDKVYESASFYDACDMTVLAYDEETHVVINLYNMMGTNKKFTILAFQNDVVTCLVPWHYGTAGTDSAGRPCMTVEDYDGCYDASLEMWLMHNN